MKKNSNCDEYLRKPQRHTLRYLVQKACELFCETECFTETYVQTVLFENEECLERGIACFKNLVTQGKEYAKKTSHVSRTDNPNGDASINDPYPLVTYDAAHRKAAYPYRQRAQV